MDSSPVLTPSLLLIYQEQLKHPDDKQDGLLYGVLSLFWIVATTALVLRLFARKATKTKVWWDDYMAIGAWCCFTALEGLGMKCASLARHVVFLNTAKLEFAMRFIYVAQFLYSITVALYKAAILHYYQRIFTTKVPKLIIRGLLITVWTLEFVCTIAFLCECRPIGHAWSLMVPGRCFDVASYLLSMSIIGIVLDAIILLLPVPLIWQLQLSRNKKWSISGIFILGALVLIASIMRSLYIRHLVVGTDDPDPVWNSVRPLLWSAAELCLGITCSCLPSIWPLVLKVKSDVWSNGSWRTSKGLPGKSDGVPLSDFGRSDIQSPSVNAKAPYSVIADKRTFDVKHDDLSYPYSNEGDSV